MTIQEIRKDLDEIRCFYVMLTHFREGTKVIPNKHLEDKIAKYSNAILMAPAKIYAIYLARYIQNRTQVELANDWGYSEVYIRKLNKQLYEFFIKYFDRAGEQEKTDEA